MGVESAAIIAGSSIVGDVMSSMGSSAANQKSMDIARMQDRFSASQAQMSRDWSEQMSDTQMQRRVDDLRKAGLNPALAYQLGGAQPFSGATAQPSGNPSMQNTGAAFANLGEQTATALQTKSQINLQNAQAEKAQAEAGTEIPASVERIKSETGLNTQRAQEVAANVKMMNIQLSPAGEAGSSMYAQQYSAAAGLSQIKAALAGMDQQERADTLASTIKARNDLNYAAAVGAENLYHASESDFAKLMAYLSLAKPLVSTAQGAAAMDVLP